MTDKVDDEMDAGLILAAEECPPGKFSEYHVFSPLDSIVIRKLSAHGPVLIRGGRGSGKSALLIEAERQMAIAGIIFPVYMSLRYLPLLQSDGEEYINHFCVLLSNTIRSCLIKQKAKIEFPVCEDEVSLQHSLSSLSQQLQKRIVILFDDAAHIGREKPLEVFFDLFRTLSSSTTSCKASIYPGVTKFGTRFDVYNDSTVIDISRTANGRNSSYFFEVLKARYPQLATRDVFSDRLTPEVFSRVLGRSLVGNMRAFILACNKFEGQGKIGIPELNVCLLDMATDYYWGLMDEVAPKLGVYEPLIEPTRSIFELTVEHVCRPLGHGNKTTASDRITIHRQVVSRYAKIFEILEYLGFVSKLEASRSMKSGGRGPVFAINLCSLLDEIPTKRLTMDMAEDWVEAKPDLSEIHLSGSTFSSVNLPQLPEEQGLGILEKDVAVLAVSRAYPYGLTSDKISRLKRAGISTVGELAQTSDAKLISIHMIGEATVKRIRDVTHQAIWM